MLAVAMKITLPRPYAPARRLTWHQGLALDLLRALAGPDGIGTSSAAPPVDLLARNLGIPAEEASAILDSLKARRVILLTEKDFAISSQLSKALRKERDRNRHLGANSPLGTPADWTLHHRARLIFPCLRAKLDRPASYTVPAAFAPLLSQHEHFHRKECPADVEVLTEACYPGELSTVLTMIEEQRSRNRQPVLLYTRKAIYLAIRRAPKR